MIVPSVPPARTVVWHRRGFHLTLAVATDVRFGRRGNITVEPTICSGADQEAGAYINYGEGGCVMWGIWREASR